jgi:hypothetical protein
MPYLIRRPKRRIANVVVSATLVMVLSAASVSIATAKAPPSGSTNNSNCTMPKLWQPFRSWNDSNLYALVPGETPGSFNGAGWALTGGASVEATTGRNGAQTSVLNLPSGSKAVSPWFCVDSGFPFARTFIRNLVGSEGVFFYVSYAGTNTQIVPQNTGQVHGTGTAWSLSDPVNLAPNNVVGWQVMRITLIPGGQTSDFQIYNLYADPYSRGA